MREIISDPNSTYDKFVANRQTLDSVRLNECASHFAIGLLGVFKIAPMANYSELSFKSSEIGTLMTRGLPTRAFSESISNVNLSFCT